MQNLVAILSGSIAGAILFVLGVAFGTWLALYKGRERVRQSLSSDVGFRPVPSPKITPTPPPARANTVTAQRFIMSPDKRDRLQQDQDRRMGELLRDLDPEL